jgi:hypothetical protein
MRRQILTAIQHSLEYLVPVLMAGSSLAHVVTDVQARESRIAPLLELVDHTTKVSRYAPDATIRRVSEAFQHFRDRAYNRQVVPLCGDYYIHISLDASRIRADRCLWTESSHMPTKPLFEGS